MIFFSESKFNHIKPSAKYWIFDENLFPNGPFERLYILSTNNQQNSILYRKLQKRNQSEILSKYDNSNQVIYL